MPHYFDAQPQSDHSCQTIKFNLSGHNFQFITDSGVFSKKGIDYGSRLLIESVIADLDQPHGRLLDLGCGYGPVGIIFKRLFPHLEVFMSDVNKRALSLARKNARLNQVDYVQIFESDGLENLPGNFDYILLNPPVRAGKNTVFSLYDQAVQRLLPGGRLYVVIQKKQGAASSEKYLQSLADEVEKISRSAGYWIWRASNNDMKPSD